jgi:uncharacterized membrane protein YhiD involved in acid resistance
MTTQLTRLMRRLALAGLVGGTLFQTTSCVDPDIGLRTALLIGSDAAIFLLQNLLTPA